MSTVWGGLPGNVILPLQHSNRLLPLYPSLTKNRKNLKVLRIKQKQKPDYTKKVDLFGCLTLVRQRKTSSKTSMFLYVNFPAPLDGFWEVSTLSLYVPGGNWAPWASSCRGGVLTPFCRVGLGLQQWEQVPTRQGSWGSFK